MTATPSQHSARMERASGVPTFVVRCNPAMWDRTKSLIDDATSKSLKDGDSRRVKPSQIANENGLTVITMDGPEMIDYLRAIDWHAPGSKYVQLRDKNPIAARMYDAIAARIDTLSGGQDGTAAKTVEITVND